MPELSQHTTNQSAKIIYDVNIAAFKDGPHIRQISIAVNVNDENDCAQAIVLLGERLAKHFSK